MADPPKPKKQAAPKPASESSFPERQQLADDAAEKQGARLPAENDPSEEGSREGSPTRKVKSLMISREWSGPLPPPAVLEKFDEIVPGAAEKIFNAFTSEVEHRQRLEERGQRFQFFENLTARVFAFLFTMLALAAFCYAVYKGEDAAAATLGGLTIASVVGTFIYGKKQQKKTSGDE